MSHEDLPEDLRRLEHALARRPLPAVPVDLRQRALGEVRRARTRERGLVLTFSVAAAAAVGALWLSMPADEGRPARGLQALVQAEARALETLGLEPADAARLAFVAHAVPLQPLAPPVGSGTAVLPAVRGR